MITGTPKVGKTAVSHLLASKLDAIHIDLAKLVKEEKLTSGVDEVRDTLIADVDEVSKQVQKIVRASKRDVIVDGHYAMDVLPAEDVHLAFILRRHPRELKKMMENHEFKGRKIWENLAAEILDTCLWDSVQACGLEKVCEIDTTGKKAEEVAKEIVAVLKGERECRIRVVDWLEKLEKEGVLDEFLKDF